MKNENLVKTFYEMVRIDSPSGEEEKFADFCVSYLKKLDFKILKDKYGNIIARNTNNSKTPFLLSAHLDTISPGRNIKPIIKNGTIVSSGDTILGGDNKLAIAIYFEAIKTLIDSDEKIRPLEIVLTRNEEVGMLGARNLDFSKIHAKKGISLDAEGDIYQYIASSPDAEIFKIELMGKAAHAGRPEKGIDTLKILSKAYNALKTGRINHDTTLNFGLINGGDGSNIVIGKINLEGNLRSHRSTQIDNLKKKIKEIFSKFTRMYNGKFKIKFKKVMKSYTYPPNHKDIKNLEAILSHKLFPKKTNGGSDVNIFNEHGIEVVDLCNDLKDTHTVKERISINSVAKLHEIVKLIISE